MFEKLKNFLKKTYDQLVHLHDSPHRIAGGVAVGVLFSVLPSAGPFAALGLAFIFRLNRAAAVAGNLLTSTWLSLVTLVFAVKLGAWATGSDWNLLYAGCKEFVTHFHWKKFFDGSAASIIKPLLIGYFIVGVIAAAAAYAVVYWLVTERQKYKKARQ